MGNRNCVIDKNNRSCMYCRLKKCLKLGMSKKGIPPYRRRSKVKSSHKIFKGKEDGQVLTSEKSQHISSNHQVAGHESNPTSGVVYLTVPPSSGTGLPNPTSRVDNPTVLTSSRTGLPNATSRVDELSVLPSSRTGLPNPTSGVVYLTVPPSSRTGLPNPTSGVDNLSVLPSSRTGHESKPTSGVDDPTVLPSNKKKSRTS
ncbi:aggrecan core protein [Elysia marginata]|uniref:Aggrecan core protein n=1 Tax=Elysia marginata TaxID=1093978 RepID=A0AAV4J8N1_9GAST|nr:aggrecan core protein [Elysia marginata]